MQERIVITGVSRGLGRALAVELARRGHTVAGCARSAEGIEAVGRQLPAPHRFDAVDVADDRQVGRWAAAVLADGPVDRVIGNAGLINRSAPLWEVPAEEFRAVIDVNVRGVFHVIRHFLPAMIERGSGVIVNFSSGWGRSTSPEVAPYCAAKWAVEGLTRALADELPAGLAAVPVNPGIIHTEMLESCFGPGAAGYPRPDAWAPAAAAFLLGLGPRDNGRPQTIPGAGG